MPGQKIFPYFDPCNSKASSASWMYIQQQKQSYALWKIHNQISYLLYKLFTLSEMYINNLFSNVKTPGKKS